MIAVPGTAPGRKPLSLLDPFDRLLIAQAEIEGLPLATSDGWMAKYGIDVVW
jgi:PIN domain nuclease of toxin-antitoxin system